MNLGDHHASLDKVIGTLQANPQLVEALRANPTLELHLIDYGHVVDGVLYHGTVSDMNGYELSTWTFEERGQPVRRHQDITRDELIKLWVGLVYLPVFHRCRAEDPATPVDPVAQHVVGAVWTKDGGFGRCSFLAPVDEPAPEFAEWLQALHVPHPKVRVLVQPLFVLLTAREKEKGAPLTQEEVVAVRNSASCKVMSPLQAERFNAALHGKLNVPFIDPLYCWEQWQTVRQSLP
jgi:hypothetical protein